ncbi:hypothetical protein LRP52_28910 [Photobacterium sp. ZSDE20]|nr:hypothetical protein [Photobacterium sp. ZSDE20]
MTKHSDCGYGTVGIAMRDGLVVEFGLPEEHIHYQTIEPILSQLSAGASVLHTPKN